MAWWRVNLQEAFQLSCFFSTSWQLPSTHVPLFGSSRAGDRVKLCGATEESYFGHPRSVAPLHCVPSLVAGRLWPLLNSPQGLQKEERPQHWSSARGAARATSTCSILQDTPALFMFAQQRLPCEHPIAIAYFEGHVLPRCSVSRFLKRNGPSRDYKSIIE